MCIVTFIIYLFFIIFYICIFLFVYLYIDLVHFYFSFSTSFNLSNYWKLVWDVLENTSLVSCAVLFTGFRSWCQVTSVSPVESHAPLNVSSHRTSWTAVCLETWSPSQGSLKCPMKRVRDIVHTVSAMIFRKLVDSDKVLFLLTIDWFLFI